jgi:hypothetical protein
MLVCEFLTLSSRAVGEGPDHINSSVRRDSTLEIESIWLRRGPVLLRFIAFAPKADLRLGPTGRTRLEVAAPVTQAPKLGSFESRAHRYRARNLSERFFRASPRGISIRPPQPPSRSAVKGD